ALGALAAGLSTLAAHAGLPLTTGVRLLFALTVVVAALVAVLALRLSSAVELPPSEVASSRAVNWSDRLRDLVLPLGRSCRLVLCVATLFAIDALAGGLVVQSLMVLSFHLRFGVLLDVLAVLIFGVNTLSALSFLLAAPLARRFGLLKTMVFTHLPSNVLRALVAVIPLVFPVAVLMLQARQALSQMDIPTCQAYTVALVAPGERTAAASVTSLA